MIKFLVQLLCLFVPVRSWRRAIRGSLDHLMHRPKRMRRLPGYLCALHHAGVYYTALHLGQVLGQADESFVLIDIGSTQFRARPISVNARVRNFFNILRYAEDHASLTRYGLTRFFGDYLACCELDERG